jgi:hypothetical protein
MRESKAGEDTIDSVFVVGVTDEKARGIQRMPALFALIQGKRVFEVLSVTLLGGDSVLGPGTWLLARRSDSTSMSVCMWALGRTGLGTRSSGNGNDV